MRQSDNIVRNGTYTRDVTQKKFSRENIYLLIWNEPNVLCICQGLLQRRSSFLF